MERSVMVVAAKALVDGVWSERKVGVGAPNATG